MTYDYIIIGAGAAGLFCGSSFTKKVKGLILEKTKKPGSKLLMSGNGQCNITHSGSIKDFVPRYGKGGTKIRSCLYRFNNLDLMEFLQINGVTTTTREDGKVFPTSLVASDILDVLLRLTKKNGFSIQYESPVLSLSNTSTGLWQVNTQTAAYLAKRVIIATGGCSYPTTGSDGSIFPALQESLQISVTPLLPALSPVYVQDYPYTHLSGTAFSRAKLSIWRSNRKITDGQGPLLFTHENFSGPLILNLSKYIQVNDKIVLNYLPDYTSRDIANILAASMKEEKKSLENILSRNLSISKNFSKEIISHTGSKLKSIGEKLTADTFTVRSIAGFNKAMVTNGGIALEEVQLKTMELKNHPGLYAIGEVLDIDGETGGYNLQFAYSSARTVSYSTERLL